MERLQRLTKQVQTALLQGEKRHLLITGSRGAGKTTLMEHLLDEGLLDGAEHAGVCSYAVRDGEGFAVRVMLRDRATGKEQVMASGDGRGKPVADAAVLDDFGVQALRNAADAPGSWAAVDEVGFLESASESYCAALMELFGTKRVAAVLRKANLPHIRAIFCRGDVFVLDLDEQTHESHRERIYGKTDRE